MGGGIPSSERYSTKSLFAGYREFAVHSCKSSFEKGSPGHKILIARAWASLETFCIFLELNVSVPQRRVAGGWSDIRWLFSRRLPPPPLPVVGVSRMVE